MAANMASSTKLKKGRRVSGSMKTVEDVPQPSSSPSRNSDRSSPDPVCAICLGKHENKSFTNSCLHEFCFKCLLEWSKVSSDSRPPRFPSDFEQIACLQVKPECPLCKQQFNAIIHNVKSNQEYEEYKIEVAEPENPFPPFTMENIIDGLHQRFRYRSVPFSPRQRIQLDIFL